MNSIRPFCILKDRGINMRRLKCFLIGALFIFPAHWSFAQRLSNNERTFIATQINEQIRILSQFSYENPELIPVYSLQLYTAEEVLNKYKEKSIDYVVFESWYELKNLLAQNREIIDFLLPRTVDWTYRRGIAALQKKDIPTACRYFKRVLELNNKHVMSQYQLAKVSLDSGRIALSAQKLTSALQEMAPNDDEKRLITNLLDYGYNKNLLYALALTNEGKYAYAMDILTELEGFCQQDLLSICDKNLVQSTMNKCRLGIYKDHVKIANKALDIDRNAIAENFAVNAYEYYSENKEAIKDTSGFVSIVKTIARKYIEEAKNVQGERKAALQQELLDKAKYLASFTDDKFQKNINQEVAAIEPPKSKYAKALDSLGEGEKPKSYAEKFAVYVKGDNSNAENEINLIEKKYVNEETKKPARTEGSIRKEIDDKFYETRSFLSVNSYEKALEVLSSANRLAKIGEEKAEVEQMYRLAIREITAKRMSSAEYFIWQGKQREADSLIDLTSDLIGAYKMQDDPEVIRIMQSYLKALDDKVCAKKQDEINGFYYNILDCIKRSDFYKADSYIRRALSVQSSDKCTLDKSKINMLRGQIEKQLEYVALLDNCYKLLGVQDTTGYIQQYGATETFYNTYDLGSLNVEHIPLRNILSGMESESFVLRSIEILVRFKEYSVAIEALGALQDMGYNAWETKGVQDRIAKLMSLDMYNRSKTKEEALAAIDKYRGDKWYKVFVSEYEGYIKKWYKKGSFK